MKNFIFLAILSIAALTGYSQGASGVTPADFISNKRVTASALQDSSLLLIYSKKQGVRSAYVADVRSAAQSYEASLTQSSTAAPVATVLHNNVAGAVSVGVWARTSAGVYTFTVSNAPFTAGKTFFGGVLPPNTTVVRTSTSVITVSTFTVNTTTPADGILNGHSFEIRVYK